MAGGLLKNNSIPVVKQRYKALLDEQLKGTEAVRYFPIAANAFNLFSREKIPTDVSDFLAESAVNVVFTMAGHREQELRNSPKEIGEETARRVLEYYQKRK